MVDIIILCSLRAGIHKVICAYKVPRQVLKIPTWDIEMVCSENFLQTIVPRLTVIENNRIHFRYFVNSINRKSQSIKNITESK